VVAVAAYEPVVPGSGEPDMPRLGAALEKVGMAAAEGRLVDAVRAFAAGIGTDDEVAALEQTTFFERWASAVPALLNDLGQDNALRGPAVHRPRVSRADHRAGPGPARPADRLASLWGESEQHIARRVPDTHVCELPDRGHFAPVLAPELLAEELIPFIESVHQPA
jgi:hypothetical protein